MTPWYSLLAAVSLRTDARLSHTCTLYVTFLLIISLEVFKSTSNVYYRCFTSRCNAFMQFSA